MTKKDYNLVETSSKYKRRVEVKSKVKKPKKAPSISKIKRNKLKTHGTQDYSNHAASLFPTDPLGFTSKLKKAFLHLGTNMKPEEEYYNIIKETVEVGMKHLESRYKEKNNKEPRRVRRIDPETNELFYDTLVEKDDETSVREDTGDSDIKSDESLEEDLKTYEK